jgi:hypothetical protein
MCSQRLPSGCTVTELPAALHLFVTVAVAFAALGVSVASRRWPYAFLLAVVAMTLQPSLQSTPLANVHGISIHGLDILVIVGCLGAALGQDSLRRNLARATVPAACICLIVAINLARGASIYGQAAVSQARPSLAVIAVIGFVLALDDMELWTTRILKGTTYVACCLSGIALYHAATRGIGSSASMVFDSSSGQWVTGRILIAGQAIIVALAALAALHSWAEHKGSRYLYLALGLGTIVILCQHRSVWLGATIGAAVILVRAKQAVFLRSSAALIVVGLVSVPVLLSGPGRAVATEVARSFSSVSDQRSTVVDRQISWSSLVSQAVDDGPATVTFGQPFGAPWTRDVLGRIENYSPHNWYITAFLRSGLVGVTAVILVLLQALRRRLASPVATALRQGLLIAMAAYFMAYSMDVQEAPILAVLMCTLPSRRPTEPAAFVISQRQRRRRHPAGQNLTAPCTGELAEIHEWSTRREPERV